MSFRISTLRCLMAFVAVALVGYTYPERRRQSVINTYERQKRVVHAVSKDFADSLRAAGFTVTDDCEGVGGSGDWRSRVAYTAVEDNEQSICYVEMQGFVSHDANNQPNWWSNLPVTISYRGKSLDKRFTDLLVRVHMVTTLLRLNRSLINHRNKMG